MHFRTDVRGMYLNEDLFDEAGADSRVGPRDIAELDLMAAKLTKRNAEGVIAQLGFAPRGNNFAGEIGWLWVFGGSLYDEQARHGCGPGWRWERNL